MSETWTQDPIPGTEHLKPADDPQPQNCSQCHNSVPEAAQRVRSALADLAIGKATILVPADVRTVLEALEGHHSANHDAA